MLIAPTECYKLFSTAGLFNCYLHRFVLRPFEQVTKPINLWIYLVLMSGTFTINMNYLFPWIRHKETAQALLVCDTLTLTWKTAGGDVRQHILSSMMKIYRWHTRQELWALWLWRSETGTKRRKRLNSRWQLSYKYKTYFHKLACNTCICQTVLKSVRFRFIDCICSQIECDKLGKNGWLKRYFHHHKL